MKANYVNYVKEAAKKAGGTITLRNKDYNYGGNIYHIKFIHSNGIINDSITNKDYYLTFNDMDDNYVRYIYEQVLSGEYDGDAIYNSLFSKIKDEKEHIELNNKNVSIDNNGIIENYIIEKITGTNIRINVNKNVSEPLLTNINYKVIEYINKEIENGEFI